MSQLQFDADAARRIEALYEIHDAVHRRELVREAIFLGRRVWYPATWCSYPRRRSGPEQAQVDGQARPRQSPPIMRTMRGSEAATEHAETHVCSSTEFVEIGAQDIEQSLVARFAAQVAIYRDCLAFATGSLLSRSASSTPGPGMASETLARGAGRSTPVALLLPQAYPASWHPWSPEVRQPYLARERDPRGSELSSV